MTRIGGRNVVFAWIVGVICAAVVGALAILALPLVFSGGLFGPSSPQSTGAADTPASQCRDLHSSALWASLEWAPQAEFTASQDPPVTTATALVDSLEPAVTVTCTWTSDRGSISLTVAEVGSDAGSIAGAALPAQGFSCIEAGERTQCSRTDGELVETIESGSGLWVSTSQQGWHPERYAGRVSDAAFSD